MEPLLTAAQMKEADRHTIKQVGIPELVLMEHAALAAVRRLRSRYHRLLSRTRGLVVAGTGNNGGDALAAARILFHQGCRHLQVVLVGDEARLTPSAAVQYRAALKLGIPCRLTLEESLLKGCDWILDGIFGTGLSRPVAGEHQRAIEAINSVADRKWILSLDIPSGLSAETGNPLGAAVKAAETVTFGFLKKGLVTGQAADYVGGLHLRTIQIPRSQGGLIPEALLYERHDARAALPPRRPAGHKGDYGHVYLFGGVAETQGAAILACRAALRCGAGLVTLVTDNGSVPPRLPPEVMTGSWGEELKTRMAKGNAAVGIGPGFGTTDARWARLAEVLEGPWPMVLDADALTLLASRRTEAQRLMKWRRAPTTLTPHPKEAARLLECSVEDVQKDRYAACRRLEETWGAAVLLKGRGTVLGFARRPLIVVTTGDAGLSKGGSGDVLTGVIASLLAQGLEPTRALPLGAWVHGRASELMTRAHGHTRSTLPGELADRLPEAFAELTRRR